MRLYRFYAEGDGGGGDDKGAAPDPVKLAEELAATKARLGELTAAEEKRAAKAKADDDAAAAKRGEHERLLAERDAALKETAAKLKSYEDREAKRVEALGKKNADRIKALPEKFRGIVPELDADGTSAFLDNLTAAIGDEDVAAGGQRSTRNRGTIPAECVAEWERYGKHLGTVEEWYQDNWKPRHKQTAQA